MTMSNVNKHINRRLTTPFNIISLSFVFFLSLLVHTLSVCVNETYCSLLLLTFFLLFFKSLNSAVSFRFLSLPCLPTSLVIPSTPIPLSSAISFNHFPPLFRTRMTGSITSMPAAMCVIIIISLCLNKI